MNIIAERVTGHVFVVAPDETRALEAFDVGADTYDEESEALREEDSRNRCRYGDEPPLNTYKIVVTAEFVH